MITIALGSFFGGFAAKTSVFALTPLVNTATIAHYILMFVVIPPNAALCTLGVSHE
jgi:hypothetical protein